MPHKCPIRSLTWENSLHTSDSGLWHPILLVSAVGVNSTNRLLGARAALTWRCAAGTPADLRAGRPTGPEAPWDFGDGPDRLRHYSSAVLIISGKAGPDGNDRDWA